VTDDEAFRTLGVALGADAKAVRRAYLELIKLHPPERDPERFKHIREAFECLRAARRNVNAPPAVPEVIVVPPTSPLPLSLHEQLTREVVPARRIALARAAVEAEPSEANYRLLVEQFSSERQLLKVLREAIARGHTSFVAELRAHCAHWLNPDELLAWRADVAAGRAQDGLELAAQLVRRQPEHAAELATTALERRFSSRWESIHAAQTALKVIWGLLECRHEQLAQRVDAALATALQNDALLPADLTIQLEATRELIPLASKLDGTLCEAIVLKLSHWKSEGANDAFFEVYRYHRDAWELGRRALAGTRVLHSLVPVLRSVEAPPVRGPGTIAWIAMAVLVALAVPGLSLLLQGSDAILLTCGADDTGLCAALDQWNERRTCSDAESAWQLFEMHFRKLKQLRQPTMDELRARLQIAERTKLVCRSRPEGDL
jgi:hypothetical protein